MKQMIDVIMVGPFPEDEALIKGGVQASVYGLALTLQKEQLVNSVHCIATPVKSSMGEDIIRTHLQGIPVTYLNVPLKYLASSVLHIPRVIREIRSHPNPLVHIHATGLLETLLCLFLRLKRIPFVWTLHGITEKETLQKLRARFSAGNLLRYVLYTVLERISLLLASPIIVDTEYVKREIKRKNTTVIPQGVFTDELKGLAELPRVEPLIACVGVIDPRKGHLQTIEAFARVHAQFPGARLVIAGSLTDKDYLQKMVEKIAGLQLQDCISLEVARPRSDILELLGRAQLFALHSREESQGIALCEALACGLPVVATNVGGIPYVITQGQDGILVEYGDIQGFADALIHLLGDSQRRAAMSQKARAAGIGFGWREIAKRVMLVYQQAAR